MNKVIAEFVSDVIDPKELIWDDGGLGFNVYFAGSKPATELSIQLVSYLDIDDIDVMEAFENTTDRIDVFNTCHKTLKNVEGKRLKITLEVIEE